jgi:tetratricopeptide (TPR) repeat protein
MDDVTGAEVEWSLAAYIGRVLSETAGEYAVSAAELLSWAVATFSAGGAAEEGPERTAGMVNSIVRRLQDRHLLKAERRSGIRVFRLLDERLRAPLEVATVRSAARLGAEESMLAAARALDEGDLARARRHALRASEEPGADVWLRATAESVMGNIAYSQGEYSAAREHYHNAAALFETLQDTESVGLLLAAMGLTDVLRNRHSDAVTAMQGAISRNPTDSRIRSALTRTLREMNAGGRSG